MAYKVSPPSGVAMAESRLKKEFDFYISHQSELVEKYNGKFIVIKGETVLGSYDDMQSAVNDTKKSHALGTFLVQHVQAGSGSYTQNFHSRVAFH
jgi:hypothetical protein